MSVTTSSAAGPAAISADCTGVPQHDPARASGFSWPGSRGESGVEGAESPPPDPTVRWRKHQASVTSPNTGAISHFRIVETVRFKNKLGEPPDGLSPGAALDPSSLGRIRRDAPLRPPQGG